MIKQVGRVYNIIQEKEKKKNSIDILSQMKNFLEFSEDVDLISQKKEFFKKIENIKKQIDTLNNKLKNKAYLKNAPGEIVQNDKRLIKELTVEEEKLRSIVVSII